jgi:hypothetical protein
MLRYSLAVRQASNLSDQDGKEGLLKYLTATNLLRRVTTVLSISTSLSIPGLKEFVILIAQSTSGAHLIYNGLPVKILSSVLKEVRTMTKQI